MAQKTRTVVCPACKAHLTIASSTTGKVQCCTCDAIFLAPPPPLAISPQQNAAAGGVGVLCVIGLVMSMQSVTLLTGSGIVWTGVAIAGAGAALSFFLRAQTWVRVVSTIIMAIALVNAFVIEHQMDAKRAEITHVFNR